MYKPRRCIFRPKSWDRRQCHSLELLVYFCNWQILATARLMPQELQSSWAEECSRREEGLSREQVWQRIVEKGISYVFLRLVPLTDPFIQVPGRGSVLWEKRVCQGNKSARKWLREEYHMGWLRSVGSIKLYVSFAEYCLFYRALLQMRPMILLILLTLATPYVFLRLVPSTDPFLQVPGQRIVLWGGYD